MTLMVKSAAPGGHRDRIGLEARRQAVDADCDRLLEYPLAHDLPFDLGRGAGLDLDGRRREDHLGRTDHAQCDGGNRDRLLARRKLPLGLKNDRHRPQRNLERRVDRDCAQDRFVGDRGRRHRQPRREEAAEPPQGRRRPPWSDGP